MIPQFDLHTAPLTEDEKKLVPIIIKGLYPRVGSKYAIHASAICKAINDNPDKYNGARLTDNRLRKITNYLRSACILPVIATSKGYYISYDKQDIKDQIESLQSRIDAMNVAIEGLKVWLNKEPKTIEI